MTKTLEHNVLIIPDVHGRVFWKRPIEECLPNIESGKIEVVFLGDYLDPYPSEVEEEIAFGETDALKQLEESFIPLARKCPENVHLLMGNHDLQYYSKKFAARTAGKTPQGKAKALKKLADEAYEHAKKQLF